MPAEPTQVVIEIGDANQETKPMAEPVDLPSNVAASLQQMAVASAIQVGSDSRANASLLMQTLGAGIAATQNLLGTTTAARAVSGINGTPLAGPVEPAK